MAHRGPCRLHAFRHGPPLREDVGQATTLGKLDAKGTVATERARCRQEEVAHTGEARERHWLGAHGGAQAGNLGEPPRDQCRLGIEAKSQSNENPGGQRNDVLEGPAKLDADERAEYVEKLNKFCLGLSVKVDSLNMLRS